MSEQNSVDEQSKNQSLENYRTAPGERLTTDEGVHSNVFDEGQKIAGKDPDFHRRTLWDSIEMGNYPEYELGVQIVEEEDELKFDFDILDSTK